MLRPCLDFNQLREERSEAKWTILKEIFGSEEYQTLDQRITEIDEILLHEMAKTWDYPSDV